VAGLLEIVRSFLPLLVTLALVLAILLGAHITLRRRRPGSRIALFTSASSATSP